QREQPAVHPLHEVMEVLAAARHLQAAMEDLHQPGLAAADRAPEIDAAWRVSGVAVQLSVQVIQGKSGALLGRIGQDTTFECLLQSLKGGTKVNRRSHGRLCSPRSAGNANGCRSTPCTPCKCATGPGPGPRRGWYHRRKSSGVPSVLFAEEVDGQHRQRPGADDQRAFIHEKLGVVV